MTGTCTILPFETARRREFINPDGELRIIFDYYTGEDGGPQGYVAQIPPDGSIRTHFHQTTQFQVFFGNDGARYQSQRLEDGQILVHYVDGYRAYGPMSTEEHPFDFLTLRPEQSTYIRYMPEARQEWAEINSSVSSKRHLKETVELRADVSEAVEQTELFARDGDGLWSLLWRTPADTEITGPAVQGCRGQYYAVLQGSIVDAGATCGPKSLGWLDPGAAAPTFRSGPNGVVLLMVQFPMVRP